MASGIWFVVVIPAIISFIFSVWVTIDIMADVAKRGYSSVGGKRTTGSGSIQIQRGSRNSQIESTASP